MRNLNCARFDKNKTVSKLRKVKLYGNLLIFAAKKLFYIHNSDAY
jgi:hypothetical protein